MQFNINTLSSDTRPAGVRALHYLADLLRSAGQTVQCIHGYGHPPPDEPDGIAVYPDMIKDDPFRAKKIVRFFFYYPDFYFGKGRIPKREMVLAWHDKYVAPAQAIYDGSVPTPLTIPIIEPDLFYPEPKIIPACLYVGNKGHCQVVPDIPGAIVVDRFSHSRPDFASVLRRTRNFYSTDHDSATLMEAKLCGCQTFICLGPHQFKEVSHSQEGFVMEAAKDIELAHRFVALTYGFFGS